MMLIKSAKFSKIVKQLKYLISSERNYCRNALDEPSSSKNTHFGFETVSEEEKSEKVYKVFENVAEKYDLMNDAMSFGVHRLWKDYFVYKLGPTARTQLIDVAGGTGDIAFRFLKHVRSSSDFHTDHNDIKDLNFKPGHVTVVDVNQAMLDVGRQRCSQQEGAAESSQWIKADAEKLPFERNVFDAYTIAFGIRNCTHVDRVLAEAYRVLKPGGRFMCLEFSRVTAPLISTLYDAYSFQVIPALGHLIAKDWNSYQYLVESVRQFPDQEAFAIMIEDAGFQCVNYENLTMGVVAIHSGLKL